ncbi:unnamed protein product [Rangifer tarandus platyrhynchus]|uniref:Uncharacterized protein n=1 Tax=Rangifer tarandus platyrhynchus TaxID=3082113 RepID=A0AC59Z4G3_RANTA
MSGRTYNHETNIIRMLNFYTFTHFYCTTESEREQELRGVEQQRLRSTGAASSPEETPLSQGREQQLRFAGAAGERYPMSKRFCAVSGLSSSLRLRSPPHRNHVPWSYSQPRITAPVTSAFSIRCHSPCPAVTQAGCGAAIHGSPQAQCTPFSDGSFLSLRSVHFCLI